MNGPLSGIASPTTPVSVAKGDRLANARLSGQFECTTLVPRPMRSAEDVRARDLFRVCHPDYPERPPHWFFAHPTLVLERDGRLVGMTSFTFSPMPNGEVAYLMDTCVHPDVQGRGLGGVLFDARLRMVEALGAVDCVGLAAPHNTPMNRLLASRGFKRVQTIPHVFPTGEGVMWVRG